MCDELVKMIMVINFIAKNVLVLPCNKSVTVIQWPKDNQRNSKMMNTLIIIVV